MPGPGRLSPVLGNRGVDPTIVEIAELTTANTSIPSKGSAESTWVRHTGIPAGQYLQGMF